jgi:hypothetical protein
MALNVMLVFFRQYNSAKLRDLEKWYLGFAYGLPFCTAFIYIVVEKSTGQRIYGPATVCKSSPSMLQQLTFSRFGAG